jgi:hypothetical protein
MAAPVAAGIAALALQYATRIGLDLAVRPTRAYILKRMLMESAVDLNLPAEQQGAGMVNWAGMAQLLEGIAAGADDLDNYEPV